MILALIASSAIAVQGTASDFFPMEPGMKWTYESSGSASGSYSQEIGASTDVDGKTVTLVQIKVKGKTVQSTFYETTSNGLYVLGHDAKKLFEKPQPVFIVASKGATWEHTGPSPYEDDESGGLKLTGHSKSIGSRLYLGEKRDCLEVKTEAKIGLTGSTATTFKTTTIYAKGLGMVEMDESAQIGKTTNKRKVILTKFERAQVDGK